MKCVNPKLRKLVSLYQFNLLNEEERLSVDAHLLECDACFEEVYNLNNVIQVIENNPKFFLIKLQPGDTFYTRTIKLVKKVITGQISLIITKAKAWWKRPLIKILVPVTAVALLLLILFPINSRRYSKLAIIEDASYLAPKLRGIIDGLTSSETLFNQGIKFYEEKNYEQAIKKLSALVEKKKKDAYGHFYLGVSFLLSEEYRKGIDHLELATRFCQEQGKEILLEKCYWYLGNGYLKINDVDKATQEFQKVIEIGGELEPEAREQLARIEKMR